MKHCSETDTERMNDEVKAEIAPQSSEGEGENVKNAEQSGDLSDNGDNLDVKCVDDVQFEEANDQREERQKLERNRTPCKQECHEFSVEECNAQQVKPCDQKHNEDTNQSSGAEVNSSLTPDEEELDYKRSQEDHSEYYALKRESRIQSEEAVELKLFFVGIFLGSSDHIDNLTFLLQIFTFFCSIRNV